jgi:hypothetical protein
MSAPKPKVVAAKSASPRRRASVATPRYEIVFDSNPWERIALDGALNELRAIGDRVGFALGHAYARAAGSVLARIERFEDATAERKYRQKSNTKS